MAAVTGLGILVFLILGLVRMAGAFAVGAGISILAYHWLAQAVQAALKAGEQGVPKGILRNLVLRYPIAFGAVFIFYETHWLPFMGVLVGLFVPLAGAIVESLVLLERLIRTQDYGT